MHTDFKKQAEAVAAELFPSAVEQGIRPDHAEKRIEEALHSATGWYIKAGFDSVCVMANETMHVRRQFEDARARLVAAIGIMRQYLNTPESRSLIQEAQLAYPGIIDSAPAPIRVHPCPSVVKI